MEKTTGVSMPQKYIILKMSYDLFLSGDDLLGKFRANVCLWASVIMGCDVIWAPPECNTTSGSPYMRRHQAAPGGGLRNLLIDYNSVNGSLYNIVDYEKSLIFKSRHLFFKTC